MFSNRVMQLDRNRHLKRQCIWTITPSQTNTGSRFQRVRFNVRPCLKTKTFPIICPQISSTTSLYFAIQYVTITWQRKFSIMYKFINYSCLIYKKENEMLKFVKWLYEICMTMTDVNSQILQYEMWWIMFPQDKNHWIWSPAVQIINAQWI